MPESSKKTDFFISRNGADAVWAEWIAGELEDNGYTTVLQDWDFRPGHNFVQQMQKAVTDSDRTIALLSPQFLGADFTQPEWQVAFRNDPKGEKGLLIPIIVRQCDPEGLLSLLSYINIVDKSEDEVRRLILNGVEKGRAKKKQAFPGKKATAPKTGWRFPGAPPDVFHIPHPKNLNFTGRGALLGDLRKTLAGGESAALTQAALHGLGGIGKSQLAIEYVYRYAPDYSLVWWLRAETKESLNADYEELAEELELVSREERVETAHVVELVREDLARRDGWLLVFDNVPKPKDLKEYLPLGSAGHVLITSRHGAWGKVAQPVSVKLWEPEESVQFLLRRTGKSDAAAAGALAEDLGHLPLALEQAAAYIEETGRSLAGYRDLFREHKLRLFEGDDDGPGEQATVTTTWDLSLQEVRKDSPAAADLLHLCAFFAPDDIPVDMIVAGAEYLPTGLAATVSDSLELDRAIRALRSYSLVEAGGETPEKRSLSMHRLVQAVTCERLPEANQKTWAEAAAQVANEAFPFDSHDVRYWPACARLSPHATQAARYAEEFQVGLDATGRLLNQLGGYAYGRAALEQAKGYCERALAIDEKVYGPEHPNIATMVNNIGQILKAQGDLAGALDYTQRALAIDEKAFGPEHPEVATEVNNIGQILQAQGDLAGALEYTQRALEIDEKVYGPEHPKVAIRANNIGTILQSQGDLAGALEYTKRALEIDEKAFGPEHPNVATLVNNIGQILKAQGDLAGALDYTQRALAIDEKAFGPEHPEVATDANNIGKILQAQGDLAGALRSVQRALAIFEQGYGGGHPQAATATNDIGQILQSQGDLEGALKYTKRALLIYETSYGSNHPHVAVSANNIGGILKAQGDLAGALEYAKRALRIFESVYGQDNPSTRIAAGNLEALKAAMKE